jgi:hypothetical protein
MTIVSTEEPVAGTVNPAENEQNEVSNQPTDEVTAETETPNNDVKNSSVEPEAETKSAESNVNLSAANPEQVELAPELLATVLGFLKCGIKTKMRTLISYQDAKNDIKLVFVKGNRNVYGSQIDKLWKEVSGLKVKKFSRSCVVVNAKTILEHNMTISEEEKSKRVRLVDIYGNEITLATIGIENCWAVIDGQHRLMVCMEHPEVDLDIELLTDFSGDIMELIKIFNSTDLNWRLPDYYRSNVETGKVSNGLSKKMEEIKKIIKCSDKVASYLPTFKRDAFKKSECIKGEDNSGYTPEKGDRGMRIAKAIKYKFGEGTVKVELIDGIVAAYNSLEDGMHPGLTNSMVGFLAEMSDTMRNTIVLKMSTADYGEVKSSLVKGFQTYYEAHKEDIEERINEVQKKIDEAMPKDDAAKKTDEELKDGFPGDILKQRLVKAIAATEKKVESLTKQESSCQSALGTLKGKSKLTDKESERLADTEARLSEIQSSLVVANANIEELKNQLATFDKAA